MKHTDKLSRGDFLMIAITVSGGFVAILNQTVMSPALPSIMSEYGITAAVGQWLTSIFLLVNGLMIPVTAYLIDRFSTKGIFFTSMAIFGIGSAVCALAPNFWILLLGRVFQAAGAGIQMPFGSVIALLIFPRERRGFAMGIIGVVMGVAPSFGPTLSGWIIDEWGWQTVFYVVTGASIVVILVGIFIVHEVGERRPGKLDVISVCFSTIAFGGMLFGFSYAGTAGWTSPITIVPIVVGLGVLLLFGRRQFKLDTPLLDISVLKGKRFFSANLISGIVAMGMMVGAVITPIFLQTVLGKSALVSGLVLMPGALIMAGMGPIAGKIFDRFGPRVLNIVGLSIIILGCGLLSFLTPSTPLWYVGGAYTFRMVGITLVNMPISTWGLNSLPNAKIAHGNAIINTTRQVAGSMGTALLVTIMTLVSGLAFMPGSEQDHVAMGISAAFAAGALLTIVGLVLAIVRVRGGGEEE